MYNFILVGKFNIVKPRKKCLPSATKPREMEENHRSLFTFKHIFHNFIECLNVCIFVSQNAETGFFFFLFFFSFLLFLFFFKRILCIFKLQSISFKGSGNNLHKIHLIKCTSYQSTNTSSHFSNTFAYLKKRKKIDLLSADHPFLTI